MKAQTGDENHQLIVSAPFCPKCAPNVRPLLLAIIGGMANEVERQGYATIAAWLRNTMEMAVFEHPQ